MAALAFDVYGTLIDVGSMEQHLIPLFGEGARAASELWRQKQLEYSFRRTIMQRYENFRVCTEQALEFVARKFSVEISAERRGKLLAEYRRLPAYADVAAGLETLRGHRLIACSNGVEADVRSLLEQAGILGRFEMIVSADDVGTFKPSRVIYDYLADRADADKHQIWMISSNPFDVIGAKSAGLRAAWVRRDASAAFDAWEFSPDATISGIGELAATLK